MDDAPHTRAARLREDGLQRLWRSVAPDEFVVTAQRPRAHSFHSPDAGHHDPLLLAESVRQAIPPLSHVAYDVPCGHRQIWDTFSYSTEPAALVVGSRPADIMLHIRCSGIARRAAGSAA
ncbi:AfsA-related hotdog domain-containing protein [Streptomyces sp. IGB124]|uniref:AfsA-related hotdog domain-containing protein n=1 Tax=Streptomyces sp. IGB124 TaxID=1519485 RepID=UPI0006AFBDF0|nr:AfsA-related hotdog domain-containing protein [Streptomyces sp. IGB124]